jgi:hypothetical protein
MQLSFSSLAELKLFHSNIPLFGYVLAKVNINFPDGARLARLMMQL